MMRNLCILVAVYFKGLLKLGQAMKIRDPKARAKALGMGLLIGGAIVSIPILLTGYYLVLSESLAQFGREDLLLVNIMAATSLMVLVFSVMRGAPVMVQFKDYELQAAMPIPRSVLVASRLVIFYLMNLIVVLAMMAPAIGVYGYLTGPGILFYVRALAGMLLVPVLPVVLGALLSMLVALISSRARFGTAVQVVLLLALAGGIVYLSMAGESMTGEAVYSISLYLETMVMGMYPLARLFFQAVLQGSTLPLLAFGAISLVPAVLFSLVAGRHFGAIHTRLTTTKSRGRYQMTALKSATPGMALYRRDLRRYFSSAIYVVNTIFGTLMLLILAGYVVFQRDAVTLLAAGLLGPDYVAWLPGGIGIIAAAAVAMGCTTGVSLSIEGRQIDALKGMPVEPMSVFYSKMLVTMTTGVPCVLISTVVMGAVLGVSSWGYPLMILLPLVHLVLASATGLVVNLYFPKMEWSNETEVVKQSMGTLLTMLANVATALVPAWLIYRFGEPVYTPWMLLGLFAAGAVGLLVFLRRRGGTMFYAL